MNLSWVRDNNLTVSRLLDMSICDARGCFRFSFQSSTRFESQVDTPVDAVHGYALSLSG